MELLVEAFAQAVFGLLGRFVDFCLWDCHLDVPRPIPLQPDRRCAQFPGLEVGLLQIHLVPAAIRLDVSVL